MKEWSASFLDSDVDGRTAHFIEISGNRHFAADAKEIVKVHNAEKAELEAENTRLREALRTIEGLADYRKVIRWLTQVGGALDKPFNTVDGLLQFTLYTDLCHCGEAARNALNITYPGCPTCGQTNDCDEHNFHPKVEEHWAMRRQMAERALAGTPQPKEEKP